MAIQNVVAVLLCELFKTLGYIKYRNFERSLAMRWLPVNMCFSAMLVTSFLALKHMNVPMVTIFKNLTNILIVAGDWKFNNIPITAGVALSFGVMLCGAIAASYQDMEFNAVGYFWMACNCVSTAGYVLSMKHATQNIKLSKFGMVFYNNVLSTPIMLALALLKGEVTGLVAAGMAPWTAYFAFVNLYAGAMGFLLNLASLWAVSNTSATTYAIVGSVNKVPTALLGYFFFQTPISAQGATFIGVSMVGGFIYSAAKLRKF